MAEKMSGVMWQGKPVPESVLTSYFANQNNPNKGTNIGIPEYDPNKSAWNQGSIQTSQDGKPTPNTVLSSYFGNPKPAGIEGFSAGNAYGQNVVNNIYGSKDQQDVWKRLQDENSQGLNAQSMASLKSKYGSQGVTEQAKIQKSGIKGMGALRASEDLARNRREDAAAQDYAIKKQSFDTYRDELGRRTLLAVNLPMAYGQLGSAASLGQTMQQLAGQGINVG